MNIFGKTKPQYRMQFFFYDNNDVEFIRRPLVGGAPTALDAENRPVESWVDYFQELYPFDGYRNIPADAVQLAYGRHFFLEIHDILEDDNKPTDKTEIDDPYISAIAEARAVEINRTSKTQTNYDKLMIILGVALILEFIIWGIAYAVRF